jgi:hypothetical protein
MTMGHMFSFDWVNIILGFSCPSKVLDQGIGNFPCVILEFLIISKNIEWELWCCYPTL